MAHLDCVGNRGVIYPGNVLWMTAGAGILHRGYREKAFATQGGALHMVQLWVNLPRVHTMMVPRYQPLQATKIGQGPLMHEGGMVRVIAGRHLGTCGPALTFSPVTLLDTESRPAVARFERAAGRQCVGFGAARNGHHQRHPQRQPRRLGGGWVGRRGYFGAGPKRCAGVGDGRDAYPGAHRASWPVCAEYPAGTGAGDRRFRKR